MRLTKRFRVLQFIAESETGRTFTEIQKFVVQDLNRLNWDEKIEYVNWRVGGEGEKALTKGKSCKRRKHRGYWCDHLNRMLPQFCVKVGNRWRINALMSDAGAVTADGQIMKGATQVVPRPIKLRDVKYSLVKENLGDLDHLRNCSTRRLGRPWCGECRNRETIIQLLSTADEIEEKRLAELVRAAAEDGRLLTIRQDPFEIFRRMRPDLMRAGVLRMDPQPRWYVKYVLEGGEV